MAKNKTTETKSSVTEFINSVADETKRKDSFAITDLMKKETGLEPKMWGPSIIGFGIYHYTYESGHSGEAPLIGFSPRKDSISLYLSLSPDKREEFLEKFGKHKTGKACIYIKKLDDIDMDVFKKMIRVAFDHAKTTYAS